MADHRSQWVDAFLAEWCRLSEGLADPGPSAEFARDLYAAHGQRDPVEVAAEMWAGDAGRTEE
jgi:hypothetical protein